MKITNRILALVMTMLMLAGSCAVAASAAGSLQAAIDDAAAGDVVVMSADTTESVVIRKDLTLDLGGYTLTGVPGSAAIVIENANVTVTNGQVYSRFAQVKSLTMMETVVNHSPAAIHVDGGSVSVEGVRAVGSCTRIPTTQNNSIPTGSAIELMGGATAVVKQSALVGRYGVNNKVNANSPGGDVTIEDAILMGFMRGVKDSSKEIVPDDTEKVNAADRIEGYLNNGIKLEPREKNLLKRVFAERVMVYTKSVQDDATFSTSECSDLVTVTAHEDDANLWQNNTSTDCSYKYVPEYVVLADGTLVKMTEGADGYTAQIDPAKVDGIKIKYRLNFEMLPDVKEYAENFDEFIEKLYDRALGVIEATYEYALEKYTSYVNMAADILKKIDSIGNKKIGSRYVDEIDEYKRLCRAILDLGGATIYNVGHEFPFSENQMHYYYGPDAEMPADGIVGTIDRVTKLKNELEAFLPFSDQSKWADLGYWAYENYTEVIDIIDEAQERIAALQTILDGELESEMIRLAKLESKRAMLDKVQDILGNGKAALDKFMSSSTVQYVLSKADSHKSELKPYINKFISIYNHHDRYFTPSKFLNDGFVKAYAVYGDVEEGDPITHDFGDWEADPADEQNQHIRTCSRCGETETEPHAFEEETTPATCTEPGSTFYTCTVCGYSYDEPIAQLEHDWSAWTSADENNHIRTCSVGGETETEAHAFDEETTPASCTAAGKTVYTCSVCGYSYEETIPQLEHDWSAWTKADEQ
ncbi:MAG: hypothetical protein IJT44_11615, partial [Clostridia bacterium]|nr:hypothetical protein [Clostridia bacterium]